MNRNVRLIRKLLKGSAKGKTNPSETKQVLEYVYLLPKCKLPLTQREMSFVQASVAKLYLYCGAKGAEYAELLVQMHLNHERRE